jgi:hypothetical protein
MDDKMTFEEIVKEIDKIIDELFARELSSNCVWSELTEYGWDELCDKAIEYIRMIRGTNND